MRFTGKRSALPSTARDGRGPISITYLSMCGLAVQEPQIVQRRGPGTVMERSRSIPTLRRPMKTTGKPDMRRFLAALALAASAIPTLAADITGAGATFPYPIYAKWADAYKKQTGNGMNYQSIGSGGGIKQITAKTVDFGASDMPLKGEDLAKYGLVQFPAIIGGNVPV